MTFADIPLGEPFKDHDGVTYTKMSDADGDKPGKAWGPAWRWRDSQVFEFDADDEIEEFCRWRLP